MLHPSLTYTYLTKYLKYIAFICVVLNLFQETKKLYLTFEFCIISRHWAGAGSCNHFSWMTTARLFCQNYIYWCLSDARRSHGTDRVLTGYSGFGSEGWNYRDIFGTPRLLCHCIGYTIVKTAFNVHFNNFMMEIGRKLFQLQRASPIAVHLGSLLSWYQRDTWTKRHFRAIQGWD